MTNKYCLQIHQNHYHLKFYSKQAGELGIREEVDDVIVVERVQPGRMHCHPRQIADSLFFHAGGERCEEPFELTETSLPLVGRDWIRQDQFHKNLSLTEDHIQVFVQVGKAVDLELFLQK